MEYSLRSTHSENFFSREPDQQLFLIQKLDDFFLWMQDYQIIVLLL